MVLRLGAGKRVVIHSKNLFLGTASAKTIKKKPLLYTLQLAYVVMDLEGK